MALFRRHTTSRRCAHCDIHWPCAVAYVRCPGCREFTSVITSEVEPLDEDEARTKANALNFERYLEGKGKENREESLRINAAFDAVIEGGGWTPYERREVERLEAQLPKKTGA